MRGQVWRPRRLCPRLRARERLWMVSGAGQALRGRLRRERHGRCPVERASQLGEGRSALPLSSLGRPTSEADNQPNDRLGDLLDMHRFWPTAWSEGVCSPRPRGARMVDIPRQHRRLRQPLRRRQSRCPRKRERRPMADHRPWRRDDRSRVANPGREATPPITRAIRGATGWPSAQPPAAKAVRSPPLARPRQRSSAEVRVGYACASRPDARVRY